MTKLKNILKKLLPPIVLDFIKKEKRYGFFGNYSSWQESLKHSSGYDKPEILEKVRKSLLKIKNGEAVYERDSVIFDHKQYSWPILAALLWISSQKQNKLNILDFGGSLGSSYFQNKEWLKHLSELRWCVVEQKNFVECGKKEFENKELKFYHSIDDCMKDNDIDIFFASSTMQYVENPYGILEKIARLNFDFLVFDRTPFLNNIDRITIQKVRPGIYDASYPAWFLNKERFVKILSGYDLVAEFESLAGTIDLGDVKAEEKGFIFRKK